jgi:virulence-associated protein VagC
MRFDVNEVGITKDGDNLILKPVRPNLADALAVVLAWIGIIYATLVSQNDQLR